MRCCSLLEAEFDSAAAVRIILDESAAKQSRSHNSSSLESAKEGQGTSHCPGSQCVWPKQAAESTTCCTEEHSLQGQYRDCWG
ncbi:hypothetical protein Gotur_025081 [Gossypium turneri]